MTHFRHTSLLFLIIASFCHPDVLGYLRQVEASVCMGECSQYYLQPEVGGEYEPFNITSSNSGIDLDPYVNRFVEIDLGDQIFCQLCTAYEISSIDISNDCDLPSECLVDPCSVSECQYSLPVDCVSSYCGGCHSDFYDFDQSLVDCDNENILACSDLSGISFGLCDMWMGYAIVDGACQGVSGCGWFIDEVDYSGAFFNSVDECTSACYSDTLSCTEIATEYESIHAENYCIEDSDCTSIWGDCDIGLGGCHYSVNSDSFNFSYSSELAQIWIQESCMESVCDCMYLPNSICSNGQCELTYCEAPNPAGCYQNGCSDGFDCIDIGNSWSGDFCVPSSCMCDENPFSSSVWTCTEDCNGGTCISQNPLPGDLCIYDYNLPGLHWVGIVDCNGECLPYEWLGDGWCDDSSGSLNCEALDYDNGDCDTSCSSGDVNSDEAVNVIDIVLTVECILSADLCDCSDVNQDNQVNVLDIIAMVNLILE